MRNEDKVSLSHLTVIEMFRASAERDGIQFEKGTYNPQDPTAYCRAEFWVSNLDPMFYPDAVYLVLYQDVTWGIDIKIERDDPEPPEQSAEEVEDDTPPDQEPDWPQIPDPYPGGDAYFDRDQSQSDGSREKAERMINVLIDLICEGKFHEKKPSWEYFECLHYADPMGSLSRYE